MKRGKRFLENDNIYIYVGTVIFFIFAIALGIIMYMMSRTANKIQKGQTIQESQVVENSESASTEIGKTVQEQEATMNNEDENKSENVQNIEMTNAENVTNSSNSTNANNTAKVENTTQNVKNTKTEESDKSTKEKNDVDKAETNTTSKTEETKKDITFIKPTEGEIICEYAKENLIYSETLKEWITHTAIDIKADKTSVIKSSADGIVKSIVNDPRYGLTVVIEHDDGYETVYSNLLTAEFVVEGEEVTQGQTIGTAGNTASFESSMDCHVHFELLKDGEYLDPSIYLK